MLPFDLSCAYCISMREAGSWRLGKLARQPWGSSSASSSFYELGVDIENSMILYKAYNRQNMWCCVWNDSSKITWTHISTQSLSHHQHPELIKTKHPAKSYLDAWQRFFPLKLKSTDSHKPPVHFMLFTLCCSLIPCTDHTAAHQITHKSNAAAQMQRVICMWSAKEHIWTTHCTL